MLTHNINDDNVPCRLHAHITYIVHRTRFIRSGGVKSNGKHTTKSGVRYGCQKARMLVHNTAWTGLAIITIAVCTVKKVSITLKFTR